MTVVLEEDENYLLKEDEDVTRQASAGQKLS